MCKKKEKSSCFCDPKFLLALILFLLQFGSKNDCDRGKGQGQLIDNSILFVIALYYLCCCTNDDDC